MRPRLALLLALVLVLSLSAFGATAAADERVVLAQTDTTDEDEPAVGEEEEVEGEESQTGEEGTDPATETGAGEEATEPAEPEVGPIWTYQMAKISIALFVLMLLAMGGAYYRFVHKRQQEGI